MNAYLARAAQIAVDREERATLGITDPRRTELFQRIARNLEQQRRVEANGEYCSLRVVCAS